MTGTAVQPPGIARLKSGIAGLDSILRGGFLTGGNYLIMGPPGVGKTILGNQLCFHHIAAGGRAIYLSLLAETSSRLLDQLQPFTFYTPDPVGDALYYLSGYAVLEREGLENQGSAMESLGVRNLASNGICKAVDTPGLDPRVKSYHDGKQWHVVFYRRLSPGDIGTAPLTTGANTSVAFGWAIRKSMR